MPTLRIAYLPALSAAVLLVLHCGGTVVISTASVTGAGGAAATSTASVASTGTGGASSGTGGASTGGACAGHVNYAGSFPAADAGAALVWGAWDALPAAGGLTGLDAGDAQCKALGIGADHICDLTEIQAAAAANEPLFAAIPAGTTAWMERTTPAYVEGLSGTPCTAVMVGQTDAEGDVCVLTAPGPGGRCADWTYPGSLHSDGEYIVFDTAGVPTYHYDNDTIFDPMEPPDPYTHQNGDFLCNELRAILCCHPSCM